MMLSFFGLNAKFMWALRKKGVVCFKLGQITYINNLFRKKSSIFLTIGDFKGF